MQFTTQTSSGVVSDDQWNDRVHRSRRLKRSVRATAWPLEIYIPPMQALYSSLDKRPSWFLSQPLNFDDSILFDATSAGIK